MAKTHNWVTGPNNVVKDRATHRMAADLIDHCPHLTPAAEAEIDRMIAATIQRNEPGAEPETVSIPDPNVVAAMNAPDTDWMDEVEPTPEELLAIEQEDA
jgi:hypothetical protein